MNAWWMKPVLFFSIIKYLRNKSVDELYGKPYDAKKTGECDKYIYKLIPESKAEIDKLVKSGIY